LSSGRNEDSVLRETSGLSEDSLDFQGFFQFISLSLNSLYNCYPPVNSENSLFYAFNPFVFLNLSKSSLEIVATLPVEVFTSATSL
jgi:hypothetical protein